MRFHLDTNGGSRISTLPHNDRILTWQVQTSHAAWGCMEEIVEECCKNTVAFDTVQVHSGMVDFLFTDDQTMQGLNHHYRGQKKPTNVLSFPAPALPMGAKQLVPPAQYPVGDVALAFETCAKEATTGQIEFCNHAKHLIIHGLLHLFGYDHQTVEQAREMEAMETAILARMGVSDPYAIGGATGG